MLNLLWTGVADLVLCLLMIDYVGLMVALVYGTYVVLGVDCTCLFDVVVLLIDCLCMVALVLGDLICFWLLNTFRLLLICSVWFFFLASLWIGLR